MKNIAVIGLGNIATRHRRNLKMLFPEAKLIVMSASGRIPKEPVTDSDHIAESIDEIIQLQVQFAIIASPAPFHAQHAIPLIKAGIPVLIEKPVSVTQTDAQALIYAEAQYKTPVAVGYCLRYLPSAQQVRQMIQEGVIGNLYNAFIEIGQYLPDWRPSKDYRETVSAKTELGGGVLLELSHELDYAQWILGSLTPKHVILRASEELGLEVEDNADLLMTTAKGAVVNIHLDFLQRKAHRKCRFIGSEGCIEWDLIRNEVVLIKAKEQQEIYSAPEWDKNQMYLEMVTDFIRKINGQPNQSISLQEAERTVGLIVEMKEFVTK
ncbi:Gfo/Idh/MocA family oxidoreductase [Acinetobacter oleivorans]|uniref:Gfo/Idh/MocA family oxidoreductase n=1 Tax=Acinetobacter oleivorans TaxID=1148157 RepID=A0ABR9NMS3_9GAMM|nr:Gfo/Idh/MocA family oxidoreductase [Acinetobacter oleivorans]MBE2166030.1 Gfo/Idh/MocA family oxidoreductase [Acinetobacter oleivorans]